MRIIHTANLIYVGDDRVDISPQGKDPAGAPFAPSWALRSDALDRRLAGVEERTWWTEFAARYLAEMREQIAKHPEAWESLSLRPEVTLVCSCVRAERCHRSLLARLLEDRDAQYLGERPSPYAAALIEEPPTEISRVRASVSVQGRPIAIKR